MTRRRTEICLPPRSRRLWLGKSPHLVLHFLAMEDEPLKQWIRPFPWLIVVVLGVYVVVFLGCHPGPCHYGEIEVKFSSDGYLVIDRGDSQQAVWPPVLYVSWLHEEGWSDSCWLDMVRVSDDSFEFGAPNPGCVLWGDDVEWPETPELILPEYYTLSFDLLWEQGGGVVDANAYPTIDTVGDADSVELWNGWRLGLTWSEPYTNCE